MTPDELRSLIASRFDPESAKWLVRMQLTGRRFQLDLEKGRRDTQGMTRWEIERLDAQSYNEWVHEWAASVAFAMWVTGDAEYPVDFFEVLHAYSSHETGFLLDVCAEARHLYATWVAEGCVTDESVIARVVAQLGDVIRDDE